MSDTRYADVVDATERLSLSEQESLLEWLQRRVASRQREEVVGDVQAARAEFARGDCKSGSVDDVMNEVQRRATLD